MSDQFDDIIRNKLNEGEFPFDADAWLKMEQKLDALNRKRRYPIFWWLTGGAILCLLLCTTVYYVWHLPHHNNNIVEYNIDASSQNDIPTATTTIPNNTPTISTPNVEITAHNSEETIVVQKYDHPKSTTVKAYRDTLQQVIALIDGENINTSKQIIDTSTTNIKSVNNIIDMSIIDSVNKGRLLNFGKINSKELAYNFDQSIQRKHHSPLQTDSTTTIEKDPEPRKGLAYGIVAGLGYNAPSSMTYGKLELNAGLNMQYYLNKHWMLGAAIVYNKKLYAGTAKDYKVLNTYQASYVKSIAANCDIIEVPLDVTYFWKQNTNHAWGATVGASSLFMVKEKYDYYYTNYTEKTVTKYADNQHYFALLNFGITYEHKHENRYKWSVQPYVKLPLGRIGYGQTKLYSAGINFQWHAKNP
ncbi:outer membrane protein with beta-barrel domain [Chitinophaga skermanii]|uniref:Outer membrane protein with beta-barrel domain n=1 Tax=Chitinophaga skermanii TaxID=331697 RepID=A0A327Q3R0_9BACT|nr:outer membrane beta-barrel protein [Chitinophaga skermanii]RAI98663.1 outer membrane protein with beta-barrel domain [Chitinophaga skermanii]